MSNLLWILLGGVAGIVLFNFFRVLVVVTINWFIEFLESL